MKINFKQFKIPTNITKTCHKTCDIAEDFANIIYNNVSGIRAHSLAMKIFQNDEADYDEQELSLMREVVSKFGTPSFIDAINDLTNE